MKTKYLLAVSTALITSLSSSSSQASAFAQYAEDQVKSGKVTGAQAQEILKDAGVSSTADDVETIRNSKLIRALDIKSYKLNIQEQILNLYFKVDNLG